MPLPPGQTPGNPAPASPHPVPVPPANPASASPHPVPVSPANPAPASPRPVPLAPSPTAAGPARPVNAHLTVDSAVDRVLALRPELKVATDELRREETGYALRVPPITTPRGEPLTNQLIDDARHSRSLRRTVGDMLAQEVERYTQRAEASTLLRTTREQVLSAMLARDISAVYKDALDKSTETSQLAQTEFEAGKLPQVVAFRARTALAEAQQQANDAQAEAEKALFDLKLALGLDMTTAVTIEGDVDTKPQSPGELGPLIQQALGQRPDLQAGRFQALAASLESPPPAPPPPHGSPAPIPHAPPPPPDAITFLRSPRVVELEELVKRDVFRAYTDVQTQLTNLKLMEPATDAAEENYRIAHLRFETGHGIQLEVLDAGVALTQARINRLKAAYRYQMALAQLHWAVGGAFTRPTVVEPRPTPAHASPEPLRPSPPPDLVRPSATPTAVKPSANPAAPSTTTPRAPLASPGQTATPGPSASPGHAVRPSPLPRTPPGDSEERGFP